MMFAPTRRWALLGLALASVVGAASLPSAVMAAAPRRQPANIVAPLSTYRLIFGNQVRGTSSGALSATLTNHGGVALTVTITKMGDPDFVEKDDCATLAAGATCTISVVFTPMALSDRIATFAVNDSAKDDEQDLLVNGVGVDAPAATAVSAATAPATTPPAPPTTGMAPSPTPLTSATPPPVATATPAAPVPTPVHFPPTKHPTPACTAPRLTLKTTTPHGGFAQGRRTVTATGLAAKNTSVLTAFTLTTTIATRHIVTTGHGKTARQRLVTTSKTVVLQKIMLHTRASRTGAYLRQVQMTYNPRTTIHTLLQVTAQLGCRTASTTTAVVVQPAKR